MKRDFRNESLVNLIMRIWRSTKGRIIGRVLFFLSIFHPKSCGNLYFMSMPRLINSKSIRFSGRAGFGLNARLECHQPLQNSEMMTIGNNVSFGDYAHIGVINRVEIGDNFLGGSNILIIDHSHGSPKVDMITATPLPPRERPIISKGGIFIDKNVWVGDNCVILSGAHICEGAIIPASSIVKTKVMAYSIYCENDAK